jgi:hypothetical protein
MNKTIAAALVLICATVLATAGEAPSAAKGKELFGSATLGTSGKTCDNCHPGGKGLEEAAGDNEQELVEAINTCITNPLKGKPLAENSPEMKSLVLYVKSLGKPAGK